MQVFDMRASICFYRDLLGFEVVKTRIVDDAIGRC